MVMITGDEKRSVLEQAIKEGPLSSAPIGRVLANIEVPIDIFWCPEA
jgi:6-phosphogluconolactonase